MTGCIRNWSRLFQQAYAHTKPGGYIELQEMDYSAIIQPTSRNPGTSFHTWCHEQGKAALKVGVDLRTSADFLFKHLDAAGFVVGTHLGRHRRVCLASGRRVGRPAGRRTSWAGW